MEEIDSHLQASEKKIKGPWKIIEDKAHAMYQHAQLLSAIGKHNEALSFYAEASKLLFASKNDPVWKSLFCSVGVQYASTLDYLGQFDKVGEVFRDILAVDPVGIHIGDYALYLHRRKRDFNQAQT